MPSRLLELMLKKLVFEKGRSLDLKTLVAASLSSRQHLPKVHSHFYHAFPPFWLPQPVLIQKSRGFSMFINLIRYWQATIKPPILTRNKRCIILMFNKQSRPSLSISARPLIKCRNQKAESRSMQITCSEYAMPARPDRVPLLAVERGKVQRNCVGCRMIL